MSISFSLYQLQMIDSQIMESNARLIAIQNEMEGSAELKSAAAEYEAAGNQANQLKKEFEVISQTLDQKKVKIEQSESTLYSGKEANPKLLQDLQTEIALLKRKAGELNDELLEKLIQVEQAENNATDKKNTVQIEQTKFHSKKAILTSEQDRLEQKIKRLQMERQASIGQIPPIYFKEYENLLKTKRGIAVGSLVDNACSVCGTTFTPSQCQTSRSQTEFFHCPTCHRITYGG